VAPVVASFLDAHPEIQIELVLNDRNLDLIEGGLDLALRIGPLSDSSLMVRRIGEVRRVAVASPDYLKRHGTPASPAELVDHEVIFGYARSAGTEWRFGPTARGPVIRVAPRLLVNDIDAMLLAAKAGRGIARTLSYHVVDAI